MKCASRRYALGNGPYSCSHTAQSRASEDPAGSYQIPWHRFGRGKKNRMHWQRIRLENY